MIKLELTMGKNVYEFAFSGEKVTRLDTFKVHMTSFNHILF